MRSKDNIEQHDIPVYSNCHRNEKADYNYEYITLSGITLSPQRGQSFVQVDHSPGLPVTVRDHSPGLPVSLEQQSHECTPHDKVVQLYHGSKRDFSGRRNSIERII